MEVKEVLFMNGGEGESSYIQNSSISQTRADQSKAVLERAVQSLFTRNRPPLQVLNAAELGCATSPTTFQVMETIIDATVESTARHQLAAPEIQFWLNDLPGNDFNTLFKGLSRFVDGDRKCKDVTCFVMAAPGSFYGRLFATNTLHLVHSCYSVCFLSKIPRLRDEAGLPLNKGKIYISKTSPPAVSEAYLSQFEQDMSLFLKSRSQEMVSEGRLVLITQGRQYEDPTSENVCYDWEILAEAIASMVSQQLVDEDKLDSFDVPYYVPSLEEVKQVVDKEGSFESEVMKIIATDTCASHEVVVGNIMTAKEVANNIRCYTESMVSHHFGMDVCDILYNKVTDLLIRDLATHSVPNKLISIIVVLKKKITNY